MAQGFGMGKEVVQGIGITVVLIAICVAIGSQIASAMSHGPETKPEAQMKVGDADKSADADKKAKDAAK